MVQRHTDEPTYVIKFDDGESNGVLIDQMILLPKPNTDSESAWHFLVNYFDLSLSVFSISLLQFIFTNLCFAWLIFCSGPWHR